MVSHAKRCTQKIDPDASVIMSRTLLHFFRRLTDGFLLLCRIVFEKGGDDIANDDYICCDCSCDGGIGCLVAFEEILQTQIICTERKDNHGGREKEQF